MLNQDDGRHFFTPGRLARIAGATAALALVCAVVVIARPHAIWQLVNAVEPGHLLAALAAAFATLLLRGVRLVLMLPPRRLGLLRGVVVAAAAQAAALFVPARLGELALPWLLHRLAGWQSAAGLGTLLAARTLDLAGLGIWAGIGVAAVWGVERPLAIVGAAALLLPALFLPTTLSVAHRVAAATLSRRGPAGQRWADRFSTLARSIDGLRSTPLRLAAAAIATLAMWASVWVMTYCILVAMGHAWPPATVVAGSAFASVANLLPLNLIANLGTLEAGWTAAFVALGVPLEVAAATGVAAHLWALIFAAAFGALAWGVALATDQEKGRSP